MGSRTLHSALHNVFTTKDDEDVQQVIELNYEEDDGEGKL